MILDARADEFPVIDTPANGNRLRAANDNAISAIAKAANTRDAELHPVGQTFGNGVSQTNTYDPNTGLLTNVRAGPSDQVAAFDYSYDTLGNLNYRSDNLSGVFECSCYDSVNRLTQYAVGNGVTSCTAAISIQGWATLTRWLTCLSLSGTELRPLLTKTLVG
jgi:hypothetical protein